MNTRQTAVGAIQNLGEEQEHGKSLKDPLATDKKAKPLFSWKI